MADVQAREVFSVSTELLRVSPLRHQKWNHSIGNGYPGSCFCSGLITGNFSWHAYSNVVLVFRKGNEKPLLSFEDRLSRFSGCASDVMTKLRKQLDPFLFITLRHNREEKETER